jgi:hypothetical protein
MSDAIKSVSQRLFRADLDAQIIGLPGRSLRSMLGIFTQLESLAHRKRNHFAVAGSAQPDQAHSGSSANPPDDGDWPKDTTYRDLGRQMIHTAQSQVHALQARTQEIQSLLLINRWPAARRLCSELLADCATPLCELSFLEDLWQVCPGPLAMEGCPLARHWHQFIALQAEVDLLLARGRSLVELSDILERHLGLWLRQFDEILGVLDEKSLP